MAIKSSTAKLAAAIESVGRRFKYSKGEVIESTDTLEKLFYLKSGFAKKYLILNDGSIRTQIIYGPGDIFPLSMAFKAVSDQDLYAGPEVYYYETMSKAEIIIVVREQLAQCVDDDVRLYKDLFSEAGRRLYHNIERLENLSLPNYYQRVAHQIAFYAREFGKPSGKGVRLTLPLTQQDLADVLSTTRETVSLCMSDLKRKGIISSGKYIIVNNLKKLEHEAFK